MRECISCGESQPLGRFHRLHNGYKKVCKLCISKRNKKYRTQSPEKISRRNKKYYESVKNTKSYKEKSKIRGKAYREANPEKWKEKSKKWYEKNKDRVSERSRKWAILNREKRVANEQRRRFAKVKNGQNDLTSVQIEILKSQTPFCNYCYDFDAELTVDHVIPISKGGQNTLSNVVIACRSCNSSKSNKNLITFLMQRSEK